MGGLVAALCILVPTCALPQTPNPRDGSYLLNQKAPEFLLEDFTGKTVSLSAYKGKPLLLNFWATWCAPCRAEIPLLEKAYLRNDKRHLQIIGIALDDSDNKLARDLLREYKVTYPTLHADSAVIQSYGASLGLPLSVLIDAQGVVRDVHFGILTPEYLEVCLKK